jgi:hypothetical protein
VDNPVGNDARFEPSWGALQFAQKMSNRFTANKNNKLYAGNGAQLANCGVKKL